jgi:hypothetical protein
MLEKRNLAGHFFFVGSQHNVPGQRLPETLQPHKPHLTVRCHDVLGGWQSLEKPNNTVVYAGTSTNNVNKPS